MPVVGCQVLARLALLICMGLVTAEEFAEASVASVAVEGSVPGEEKPTKVIDLTHLLNPSLQAQLEGILERHGHPEQMEDEDTNMFLHALLPNASLADSVFEEDDTTTDLEGLMDSLRTERKAEDEAARRAAREAAERAEEERQRKHDEALFAEQAAREEAREKRAAERAEAAARQKEESEAARRKHEEFMQKNRDRTEAARKRQHATQERHAAQMVHMEEMLRMAHDQIAKDTNGFRDAPFWDDFFQNTSTKEQWSSLGLEHVRPALAAAALQPHHRVLILEPSSALGLAGRIAEAMRVEGSTVDSHAYGSEPDDAYDLVLELGLLDAMAMGGSSQGTSRLSELRRASGRLSGLLRPGGAWLSVSAVPPSLRVPLLQRLGGGTFAAPEESGDHVHTVVLRQASSDLSDAAATAKMLRGASAAGPQEVANLLLYGQREAHAFVYRLERGEGSAAAQPPSEPEADQDLEGIIASQRPGGPRDDL
eukprot:gnl/TRDRNA2_/TRDRNA2_134564_c0_seq1.p1 gnl/TRDRNA2_/TRDRNA2_134564_c0~~gnl/TRDRNA2_/TRDRNA2_134564_c0_seq1.p1  ORF type:complete len:483 (-),score=114.68 gnl/TRDRNA2_/TRDRNA2_134564_c0_seq1:85-1533(-)